MYAAAFDVAVYALALSAHLALAIRIHRRDGDPFAAFEFSQPQRVSVIVSAARLCVLGHVPDAANAQFHVEPADVIADGRGRWQCGKCSERSEYGNRIR